MLGTAELEYGGIKEQLGKLDARFSPRRAERNIGLIGIDGETGRPAGRDQRKERSWIDGSETAGDAGGYVAERILVMAAHAGVIGQGHLPEDKPPGYASMAINRYILV